MADGVDTSVYKNLGANSQAMSPLQVLQLIGAANQNKLFQQTYDARQNIGQAYKNNVDPQGNVDTRGLIRDIAGSGGFLAGEGVGQAQSNVATQLANQQAQQKYLQSTVGSLTALPNPTVRDVNNWAVNVARNTNAPPEMIRGIVDGAYQYANDPKGLKKYLATQAITALGTQALSGEAGPPTEAGAPTQISSGEAILRRAGVGPQSTQGTAPPITTGQPTGMVTGMPPGFSEAASAAGVASGSAAATALGEAGDYNARITPLTKIVHLLDQVGPTGQGIGTETSNTIKNIGVGLGVLKPNTTLPVEELKKYYTQNVLRNSDIASTDKMVAGFHGNPNIDLNTASASDLAKTDLALRRMRQAQTLYLANVPKDQFQAKAAQFNTNQDTMAYGFDLLSADAQRKYLTSLKPGSDAYNRFMNSLSIAHKYRLLEPQNAGR